MIAATLAGGTLLGTCQGRIKDGVVAGSESFAFVLLDPSEGNDFFLFRDVWDSAFGLTSNEDG